jgi:hypothetical protein
MNRPGLFISNQFALSATRVSILSPRRRPQNVPTTTTSHTFVLCDRWKNCTVMASGVKITASSRQQCSCDATGPTAQEMLSVCPTNVHTKQGPWLPRCQKKRRVYSLQKFHNLKSGRKGEGRQWCGTWSGIECWGSRGSCFISNSYLAFQQ